MILEPCRQIQNKSQFCDFRRLKRNAKDLDPARCSPVFISNIRKKNQEKEKETYKEKREGKFLPPEIRDSVRNPSQYYTWEKSEKNLVSQKIVAFAKTLLANDDGGARKNN